MIELKPLAQLDQALVDQNLAETLQRVQEDNPNLDLRRGVFAELLVYYHAILATQRQVNIDDYWRARSLKALEQDPDLADPDLVADTVSNFRVQRQLGSKATGDVTIIVSDDVTVTIARGAVFEAQGKRFVTQEVFTAKFDEANVNSSGDRLLTQTSDGNWAFVITVVAEAEGAESEIKKDTLVVPLILPSNYVTSYAANDFQGGLSAETNQDLLLRLQEGYAAKGIGGRVNMSATLREIEDFSRILHLSVVGFGDAEMFRDRHWIFPVSGGGRVDWYVRSQEQVYRQKLVKTATLIEKLTNGFGIWQISLNRDEAPGYYEIHNVRPKDSTAIFGGFEITEDVRSADLTGDTFVPDIDADSAEWGYTRYQAGVIRFKDTLTLVTDLAIGDTAEYEIEARRMPLVAEIQDRVSGENFRPMPHDLLVKAPVPCFVQLNFVIHKRSGETDPDLEAIKTALAIEINNIGFIGRLYASQLHDVIHAYLRNDQTVSAIDMLGRIRYPDSSIKYVRDSEKLEVPDEPENLVSLRTVQFFISQEDIGISVVTAVPSNV